MSASTPFQNCLRVVVFTTLVCLLFGVATARAQESDPESRFTDFHDWFDYASIVKFGESNWRYDGDYGVRGLLTDDYWTLVYFRPSVRWKPKDWMTLHGGVALFYNFLEDDEDLPELRPHVGARFTWPRFGAGWRFTHFFRLEGRFFYLKETDEWDTSARGRYQIQLRTPDFAIGGAENFYAIAFVEFFEDFRTEQIEFFGDRIRTDVGLGKQVGRVRVELNYLFHQFRVQAGPDGFDYDDHVVRLRLFHKFN